MAVSKQSYPLSAQFWRDEGNLEIETSSGLRICTLPIGSLRKSGDLNWPFIHYYLEACVEGSGELFFQPGLEPVNLSSVPTAGIFTYKRRGERMRYLNDLLLS